MPSNIAALTIKKKVPIHTFFELTRHCNLKCVHCYIVKEKRRELSTVEVKSAISQLKEENCLMLNFSGGEVFTRKDFFDIAWYAKDKGFAIKIFSNGTLIDSGISNKIAGLNPLRVEITIFSINPKIHDSITSVKGSLESSLEALKFLKEKKVRLRIKCPLMKQNVSGYRNIIKLARDFGAKYQFDTNILPKINGLKKVCRFQINRQMLTKIFRDPKIIVNESNNYHNLGRNEDNIFCSASHNSCAITAYGDILPCIALPIRAGNLKKQAFSKIWHNSNTLHQVRSARLKDHEGCLGCDLFNYCNKCPGFAYLNKGNMFAKPERACMLADIRRNAFYLNR